MCSTVTIDPSVAAYGGAPGLILEVRYLAYDGVTLFQDLRLELRAGKWTCLLGDSGVGKSTLVRIAAGLNAGPGEYSARLSHGGSPEGQVALMAQRDALLPWASVLENTCFGPRLRADNRCAARERATELLHEVGLGDYLDGKPATLSGGMRQRVALVRTLIEDRPIVLLDEPFAALDALNRHRMQDLAAKLLAGRTVLHVTHDPLEALRLAHRVVLAEGRPVQLVEQSVPEAEPPRAPDMPDVTARHGVLFDRLLNPAP